MVVDVLAAAAAVAGQRGVLHERRCAIRHLHLQADDDVMVVAVALPRHEGDAFSHAAEHLMMHHSCDDGTLVEWLELNSTARWWDAYTTPTAVSMAAGSRTMGCLRRTSRVLIEAVIACRPDPEALAAELRPGGRLQIEHEAREGLVAGNARSAIANMLDGEHPPLAGNVASLEAWIVSRARDACVFTYGPMRLEDAADIIDGAVQQIGTWRGESSRTIGPPRSSPLSATWSGPAHLVCLGGPSSITDPVLALAARGVHLARRHDQGFEDHVRRLAHAEAIEHGCSPLFTTRHRVIAALGFRNGHLSARASERIVDAVSSYPLSDPDLAERLIASWEAGQRTLPGRGPKGARIWNRLVTAAVHGCALAPLVEPASVARAAIEQVRANELPQWDLIGNVSSTGGGQ